MAVLKELVIDSLVPSQLARFWSEALDGFKVREYDDQEIARLELLGLTPETDSSVALDGQGFVIFFQKTDRPKTERNRMHFDISAEDRVQEVSRLEAMGANVRDIEETYTVMLDPEGNEFCVVDPK